MDIVRLVAKGIYKVKRTVDGNVDRYNAHLVAKSYSHNFIDTFSPVAKIIIVKIFLSLDATLNEK